MQDRESSLASASDPDLMAGMAGADDAEHNADATDPSTRPDESHEPRNV